VNDRVGWFEVCPLRGTVFLDEIAEVDVTIQVKLLRVLQTRAFQRLGETIDRRFEGKSLRRPTAISPSRCRQAASAQTSTIASAPDLIETPSLEEHLRDAPEDLGNLVLFIARAWPATPRPPPWQRRRSSGSRSTLEATTGGRAMSGNWSSACGT
jgi:hypothetical protein